MSVLVNTISPYSDDVVEPFFEVIDTVDALVVRRKVPSSRFMPMSDIFSLFTQEEPLPSIVHS